MRATVGRSALLTALIAVLIAGMGPADADVRRGEKAAQLCLLCHRPDSTAQAPLLEAQPERYLVAQIDAYRTGKRTEPSMRANVANLKPREVADIAAYFAGAAPRRHGAPRDGEKARAGGQRTEELGCASCHGAGLVGGGAVPRLAGQVPAYLERQIAGFMAGDRRHPATTWPAAGADLDTVVQHIAGLNQR
jgi:cytochrome c553